MSLLLLAGFPPSYGLAGPNADGSLVLHSDPNQVYTFGGQYFGQHSVTHCDSVNVTLASGGYNVVHVLAIFEESASPAVSAVSFGVEYAQTITSVVDFQTDATVFPESGWPDAGTSVSLAWGTPRTDDIVDVACFVTYTDGAGTDVFSITPHQVQGATFASDDAGASLDPIVALGRIGFGAYGYHPCQRDNLIPTPPPTSTLVIQFVNDSDISDGSPQSELKPIEGFCGLPADPRRLLLEYDAQAIRRVFPTALHSDSLTTLDGVTYTPVIDLSGFMYVAFADSFAALNALGAMQGEGSVESVEKYPDDATIAGFPPRDPYFDSWTNPNNVEKINTQWPWRNTGERPATANCSDSDPLYDVNLSPLSEWFGFMRGAGWNYSIIMQVDVGILDAHEDLDSKLINDRLPSTIEFSPYPPTIDFCGMHGTNMAGLTAAETDSVAGQPMTGVAGMCPECPLIEIMSPSTTDPECTQAKCAALVYEQGGCGYLGTHWLGATHAVMEYFDTINLAYERPTVLAYSSAGGVFLAGLAECWYLHQKAVLVVAGAGEDDDGVRQSRPESVYPASYPFVLGVGGTTEKGRFWTKKTGCDDTSPNAGGWVGHQMIDVSAPASGQYIVPSPYDGGAGYYRMTRGFNSGATAITAGAAGFLNSYERGIGNTFLRPDDVAGVLACSGKPFLSSPTAPTNAVCPEADCPREYYGVGMLDMERAFRILSRREAWQAVVLDRDDLVETGTQMLYGDDNKRYIEHRYRAEVDVPWDQSTTPPIPAIWIRRYGVTNTFDRIRPSYDGSWQFTTTYAVRQRITGASMSLPDEQSGRVVIECSLWEREAVMNSNVFEWVHTSPDDMKVELVKAGLAAASAAEAGDKAPTVRWMKATSKEIVCFATESGYWVGQVYDVGGRAVARFRQQLGKGLNFVPLEPTTGRGLARGIYFVRGEQGGHWSTGRVVRAE